jgi:SAM-dependent methyltransferase
MATHMIYHLPDMEAGAAEFRRALRPGGTLLAVTNAMDHLSELNDLIEGVTGNRLTRSFHRFVGENGGPVLESAFAEVEWHDIRSTLELPDPEPLLAYVASMRQWLEESLPPGAQWSDVEGAITAAAAGGLRVSTHAGVFVAR